MKKMIKSFKPRTLVSGPEISTDVFGFHWACETGISTVGMQIRENASMMLTPKQRHIELLKYIKNSPKPNLKGI